MGSEELPLTVPKLKLVLAPLADLDLTAKVIPDRAGVYLKAIRIGCPKLHTPHIGILITPVKIHLLQAVVVGALHRILIRVHIFLRLKGGAVAFNTADVPPLVTTPTLNPEVAVVGFGGSGPP